MFYGWIQWGSRSRRSALAIRSLSRGEGMFYGFISVIGILLLAKILTFTHSDIPYWDATTTILSLLAQWLLCLKIIHCWYLWFFVDAMVAGLQWYKGIPFHSAIHASYILLAILGYWRWRGLARNSFNVAAGSAVG